MRKSNTFGIHFVLRENRGKNGLSGIYMRIVVNKSRSEVSLKRHVDQTDWNEGKGMAKPKNDDLRKLNTHLEQLRGMMAIGSTENVEVTETEIMELKTKK